MPENDPRGPFAGRLGAVSLTFDDGTENQLANAVPPLDERGLCATFYLNPRDRLMAFAQPWRKAARRGHEIGNHTLSHPCPSAITGGRGLEDMTLEEVESDVLAAQVRLETLAPHQTAWTFAYPCYATYIGRGEARRSYVPVIARHFLAGRAGGEIGFGNRPGMLDSAALIGTPVERLTASEVIALIERLALTGQWLILVYHDIDGEVLSVRQSDYVPVLDYLARNRDRVLTAPVVDVASTLRAARIEQANAVG
jgi:hypothetical protein